MNYAIISNNTITAHGTARELWPDTSFATTGPNAAWLTEHNAVLVRNDPPHDPATHYLTSCEPYLIGGVAYNREPVEIPPAPVEPQWQAFAAALVLHPEVGPMVETFLDTLAVNKKSLQGMVYVGLGQAAQGDGQTFGNAWTLATMQGFVTPELAAAVAAMATTYDLPAEFVAALAPAAEEGE
jgi:hypothetical protein